MAVDRKYFLSFIVTPGHDDYRTESALVMDVSIMFKRLDSTILSVTTFSVFVPRTYPAFLSNCLSFNSRPLHKNITCYHRLNILLFCICVMTQALSCTCWLDVNRPVNPAVQVRSQELRGPHHVNILPTDANWGERFPLPFLSLKQTLLFFSALHFQRFCSHQSTKTQGTPLYFLSHIQQSKCHQSISVGDMTQRCF